MPIGPSVGIIKNKKSKIDIDRTNIKKIVASPCNVFYLSDKGILSGWGSNNTLQFGSGITQGQDMYGETAYNVNGGEYLPPTNEGWGAGTYAFKFRVKKNAWSTTNGSRYFYSTGDPRSQDFETTYASNFYIAKNEFWMEDKFLKTIDGKINIGESLKDIDIVQLGKKDKYATSVLAIDVNNKLYVWGDSKNLTFGSFSETNKYKFMDSYNRIPNKSYSIESAYVNSIKGNYWETRDFKFGIYLDVPLQDIITTPKKISDENWDSVVANDTLSGYKHILLKSDGTLHVLGGDNNGITQLGSKSDWKYISYDYAINKSNELYKLSYPYSYEQVTPNLFMGIGARLGIGNIANVFPLTSLTFPEKIKNIYGSLSSDDVLFLSETGKVSGVGGNSFGVMGNAPLNQYKLYDIPRNDYTGIKDVIITNYNSVFVQTTDNSLITWGDNRNGQLGYGVTTTPYKTPINKIAAVNGLVQSIHPSFNTYFNTLVLGTNSKLSAVGENTNGVLGLGNTTNRTTFAEITSISNIKQVINNSICNYALGNNGLLSGWGSTNAPVNSLIAGTLGVSNTYKSTVITVTTFAGTAGSSGSTNGTGTNAKFKTPEGITIDSSNNLYVCDSYNHTIRKITPAGEVTTFAGTAGSSGTTNGTGTAAKFSVPSGITIDSFGNLYVCDLGNRTIRKITPAGEVTTFAGSAGTRGSTDGTGTNARFFSPYGITIDSSNNLYVSDSDNNNIRKITPAGVVTTIAGSAGNSGSTDGTGTNARFNFPRGITIDSSNNLYVCDTNNSTIRKITPAGVVTTFAGSAGSTGSADGTGSDARLFSPRGITIDSSGDLYVSDDHRIRKITPERVVTTIAGTYRSSGSTNGIGTVAKFYNATGIIINSSNNLYVCDSLNHIIRKADIINNLYFVDSEPKPVQIPFTENINKIFASKVGNTVYTLGTNKEVSAWGTNTFGQVGINTTLSSVSAATKLPLSNIQDIIIEYSPLSTNTNPTIYERPTVYFLDEFGGLSGCGFNGNGNLGFVSTGPAVSAVTKINVPPVRKLYSDAQGFVYAIGTNNELSGWGRTATYTFIPRTNNIASIYKFSNVGPVDYLIVNDSNIDFTNGRMACVVGLNQKLTAWGGTGMIFSNTNPAEVSNVKNVSSVFINYKANNIFINGAYTEILISRKYDNIQKIGSNDWKIVDKHGDLAIKLDNTLWSVSSTPIQIGSFNDYDNVYYGTPVRSSDSYDIKFNMYSSIDDKTLLIQKNKKTGSLTYQAIDNPSLVIQYYHKNQVGRIPAEAYKDDVKINVKW